MITAHVILQKLCKFMEDLSGKEITSFVPNPIPGYRAFQINKDKIQVIGDKGQVYTLEKKRSRWSCTCTGFRYRSQCKHLQMVPQEFRHPREYLTSLKSQVEDIFQKYGRFVLCGSYRREKPTSKDLDYVIVCDKSAFRKLRSELDSIGVKIHQGAENGMSGHIGNVPIDIFRSEPQSFVTMVLWRTGSKETNIALANAARVKGLRIRRDGIETSDGTIIHPETEKEVFDLIGVPYKEPRYR